MAGRSNYQRSFEPPGDNNGATPRGRRPRATRLSRRLRVTQQAKLVPPRPGDEPPRPDFRTPSRPRRSSPAECPQPDQDSPQDIIWDPVSPLPLRSGKGGKKPAAGGVNISEMVSRIAPERGRPPVPQPVLQQWIGDSATIPCTPHLQAARTKKKSQRGVQVQDGRAPAVDDLLRLAKRFDLSVLQQEGGVASNGHLQSPELQTVEQCDLRIHRSDTQLTQDDDLDFLFDESTGHIGERLSPPSPGASAGAGAAPGGGPGGVQLEDDWEDDRVFYDSLVFEVTQNPEKIPTPTFCSTQKLHAAIGRHGWEGPASIRLVQSEAVKENFRQNVTSGFNLLTNKILSHSRTSRGPDRPPTPHGPDRTTVWGADRPPTPRGPDRTTVWGPDRPPTPRGPDRTTVWGPTAADFPLDDLDALLSGAAVWEDADDDHLLCEMCDALERQIQSDVLPSNQMAAPLTPSRGSAPGRSSLRVTLAASQSGDRPPTVARDTWFTSPGTVGTNKGLRCSSAEIQIKKQRALQRRRQRLQEALHLPAST